MSAPPGSTELVTAVAEIMPPGDPRQFVGLSVVGIVSAAVLETE
jgi:hypothetical protein